MRFSVIGPTYPYKGGISHFTTTLVKHLRGKNEVDFLSWKRQYPSFLYPVKLQDSQSKKPIETEAKFILDFFNPFTWLAVVIQIKKFNPDMLLLTWASPIQAPIYFFICLFIKLFTKTKIVYICHNVLPHENAFYDKPLIKLAFMYADKFIVHSSEDKEILRKLVANKDIIHGFLPLFNVFKQKQNIDIKKLKMSLRVGKKVLLFFGFIRPYKGLRYLLEAMPSIIKTYPDLTLLVVGEFWSKDRDKYLELVNSLRISNVVQFIDTYVPNEDLWKYFVISDVVVLPYISATQSASVQTAYAFDKPVISTTVGGLDDVIKDKISGYVIQPTNSDDIVKKVDYFYKHPIKSSAIIKFKQQFGWDKYIALLSK